MTRKENLQDLHFGFSYVTSLLDLATISDPISLKVRHSGSYGFLQKAGIQREASQAPGCLDLSLGLNLTTHYVIFWGYFGSFILLWREEIKSKIIRGPICWILVGMPNESFHCCFTNKHEITLSNAFACQKKKKKRLFSQLWTGTNCNSAFLPLINAFLLCWYLLNVELCGPEAHLYYASL